MQQSVGVGGCDAASGRTAEQALANQVGLVDFFQGVGFFAEGGTDGAEADRPAVELVNHG